MPPQIPQQPEHAMPQGKALAPRLIAWIGVIVFILVGAFFAAWYYIGSIEHEGREFVKVGDIDVPVTDISSRVTAPYAEIVSATRSGDYEQAAAQYNALVSDPLVSANVKAAAIWAGVGARYRNSGNAEDYLSDIRDLKAAIADPTVQQRYRVAALDSLGSSYCRSGRSELVFEEIYKGEPFSQYLAPGNPNLSARQLYDWSYGIFPTPKAAVRIARWYVEEPLWNTDLSDVTRQEYIAQAIKYSNDSDDLIKDALQRYGTTYLDSSPYAAYWYWRAVNQGGLAQLGVGTYKDTYKQAYNDAFTLIESQNNTANKQYLPYGYLFYADSVAKVDGDTEEAKKWLQKAIDFTLNDPGVNEFGIFIKNEGAKRPWDYSSKAIHDMMDISPEFKGFVEELVNEQSV